MVDARALLAIIEATDDTRNDISCEATSTSLESKKEEVCNLEKPHINNEDIEKILIQLVGALTEIRYLLKCLIVVLVSLISLSWQRIVEFTSRYQYVIDEINKCAGKKCMHTTTSRINHVGSKNFPLVNYVGKL